MSNLKEIKTYLPFARNTFQKLISYKANVIIFMFGDLLMLAVTYYLWKAIYTSTSKPIINGFTQDQMIIYVFITFLTGLMTSVDISYDISREVLDGSIAINLVRPINYEKRILFQGLGNVFYNFIVIFLITFILTTFLFYRYFGYINIINIVIYFISIALGILISFYFSYIFGLFSFKITNMWGMSQIMQAIIQLLSGTLIPISFFPNWTQFIVKLFPFSSVIYTPTMIYLGKLSYSEVIISLAIQVFWIYLLMIIAKFMWKSMIKNLTVVGG